jgi:hypothetical protein
MTKSAKKQEVLDKQFQMAMEGSVEMLKWLGINLCGQSNQPDTGSDELPMGFDIQVIPSREQEEFEEYREEFFEWKQSQATTS